MTMHQVLKRIYRKLDFLYLRTKIRKLSQGKGLIKQLNKESVRKAEGSLHEPYLAYIAGVSSAQMAASLQCTSVLLSLCRLFAVRKVLDFGSGFSSYAVRSYAATNHSVHVCSVDDHSEWITKTCRFLSLHRLNCDNVMMLDDFIEEGGTDYDLIFFDLNFVEVRQKHIRLIIERCKPGGMILFDDVHKVDFLYEILNQTRNSSIQFFDIKSLTLDSFGRFGLLAIKPARL